MILKINQTSSMVIIKLDESACGCSLQTGSKIIGYIFTLIGIGLIVSGLSLALDGHGENEEMEKLSVIFGASSATYGLINFMTSFLLLCGAIQAKRGCMIPFILFGFANLILIILSIPWLIYKGFYVLALFLFIPFCLFVYMILIIQNFYRYQREVFSMQGIS